MVNKIQEILELIEEYDNKVHVEEARKRGTLIKMEDIECKFSDLDTHKNETTEDSKNIDYNDLEDMVLGKELSL